MNSALVVLIGLVVVVFLVAIVVVGMYNRLVALRNRYKNAFSQIDVQLKRRYDLIPNLVETAKGYIKHERETLEAVIQARNAAYAAGQQAARSPGEPQAMTALSGAEGQLTGALGRLFAVAEAYPDLKANQNMLALQEELSATENKIAFARQAYNDSVMVYNTQREVFPTSVIAWMFNFQEANLFEIDAAARAGSPQGLLHLSARGHGLLRPTGPRPPADEAAGGDVRLGGGGHHPGHLPGPGAGRGAAGPTMDTLGIGAVAAHPTPGIRSPTPGIRRPALACAARALATAALPLGQPGDDPGHRRGQPVQDLRACRRRRNRRPDARRPAGQSADHRPGRTPAAQRGRRDGPGLRHPRPAGLRAGQRAGDQRLRRRPPAGQRRGGRLPRLPRLPHPRGTPGRDGPRVQPHPQRRHAAEPPPHRRRLRHPRPGRDGLLHHALGQRLLVPRFQGLGRPGGRLPPRLDAAWCWATWACFWAS